MMRDSFRRTLILLICALIAAGILVLFFTTADSGLNADAARQEVLDTHLLYTGADNSVSAIYLNFRLWDTLFEALVLLVSAVAVISFSRSDDDER